MSSRTISPIPPLSFLVLATLVFTSTGCGSNPPAASTPLPAATHAPRTIAPENEISGIAEREIIRRQDRILRADAAAIESHQRMSAGDLEGAVSGYRTAVSALD